MLSRLAAVFFLCVLYIQYSGAKKYEEHGQEVIDKVNASNATWKGGASKFFKGKDVEELKGFLGMKNPKNMKQPKPDKREPSAKQLGRKGNATRLAKRATTVIAVSTAVTIPTNFDWRVNSSCASIHDIRTQKCGDCWAVSSAAAFSDRYCIYTKIDKIFSAKQIATCTDPTDPDGGCQGGFTNDAANFYNTTGVTTGGDPTLTTQDAGCLRYPISWTIPTPCPAKCDDGSVYPTVNKAATWGTIANITYQIQREILLHGPVVGAMEVFQDFYYYQSGVYRYTYGTSEGFHAIRIIGWGVADDGTPYWLCLNQWGPDWGEGGAFRILRQKNHLHIEEYITFVYPVEAKIV